MRSPSIQDIESQDIVMLTPQAQFIIQMLVGWHHIQWIPEVEALAQDGWYLASDIRGRQPLLVEEVMEKTTRRRTGKLRLLGPNINIPYTVGGGGW